jgi:hypothetical protein
MSGESKVYLVDQLMAKAGQAQALLQAYREHYIPGAQARGMRLEHSWVMPPLWLEQQSNTLLFVWSLRGAIDFWAASFQGRQDPALEDWWWRQAAPLIESRQRYVAGEAADLSQLDAV